MLINIHMIKNFPPANLNRDDSGAAKTCYFCNTTRGRISSQCLKRSWRMSDMFRTALGEENFGCRTRRLPEKIGEQMAKLGVDEKLIAAVLPKIASFGSKEGNDSDTDSEKKDKKSKKDSEADEAKTPEMPQLVFVSPADVNSAANVIREMVKGKTLSDVKKIKVRDIEAAIKAAGADIRPVTIDIALWGRMVTSDAFRNVDAAMQVAHAISTGKVVPDSDYYVGMDDLLNGASLEEKGAAMLGDIDYNCACYYMYACIDTDILRANLLGYEDADALIKRIVSAVIRTMAFTNPSGKQNTFAAHILPSAMMVECVDQKIPVSLVNAFAQPVTGTDVIRSSIQALADEADASAADFGIQTLKRVWFATKKFADVKPVCATAVAETFDGLVQEVAAATC